MGQEKLNKGGDKSEKKSPIAVALDTVNDQLKKISDVTELEKRLYNKRKRSVEMNYKARKDRPHHIAADEYFKLNIYPYIVAKSNKFSKKLPAYIVGDKDIKKKNEKYYKALIESDLIYKIIRPALFAGYKKRSPYYMVETRSGFKMENDDPRVPTFEINLDDFDENLNIKKTDKQPTKDKAQPELFNFEPSVQSGHQTPGGGRIISEPGGIDVQEDQYRDSGEYDPDKEKELCNNAKYLPANEKLAMACERMDVIAGANPALYDINLKVSKVMAEIQAGMETNKPYTPDEIRAKFPDEIKSIQEFADAHTKGTKNTDDEATKQYMAYLEIIN